ncbi:MAG: sugar ABC transporter ATP-binding protein [Actinobacteria bacterium]|nr:sugar ABC transporter ATP-binding protein [Cyanobacteriota bacterium]MCL5771319.1 sugar ABC transporter ATP-binding protein [Actinomycetota bacterium]
MSENSYLLEMSNISKEFPGVKALDNVSFKLRKGEVFALVGENGAGKSTIIKILSGFYSNDKGEIKLNGEKVNIRNPKNAIDLGINTIYQETSLVPEITVAENIFLGKQPVSKFGKVNWKKMMQESERILNELSIHLNPKSLVLELSAAQCQLVEIAKAFSSSAKIIIMDEPTSAITEEDTINLFNLIKKIVKTGTSVIYISHRLKEIFEIADYVMVLRDGKTVKYLKVSETNEDELIKYMVGRDLGNIFGEKSYPVRDNIVLEVKNLTKKGKFENISFALREGEILGLSGLVGAGRSEIVRAIYGLDKPDSGYIYIDSNRVTIKNSTHGINQGITFVSEDRRTESIIQAFTVKANITILLLKSIVSKFGLLSNKKENELSEKFVREFNIKTPSLNQLVMNLSGGNQQKVALAKCLSIKPKILILDEPTKGIDVGAKKEIHYLIKELANNGMSIILVSSELPEIIGMCHRVIVMREGKLIKIFNKNELSEENLMAAAVGNI